MSTSFTPTPIQCTTNLLVNVSCDAIYTNSADTETVHELSSETNSSLKDLQFDWTTCTEMNPGDPGYNLISNYLKQCGVKKISDLNITELKTFVDTKLTSTNFPNHLNEISSAFLQNLLLAVQGHYKGNKSSDDQEASTLISTINSLISETNSTATNETQPLQSLAKTCGTLLQQDQSAMSSDASVGSIGNEVNSTLLSTINQPY